MHIEIRKRVSIKTIFQEEKKHFNKHINEKMHLPRSALRMKLKGESKIKLKRTNQKSLPVTIMIFKPMLSFEHVVHVNIN